MQREDLSSNVRLFLEARGPQARGRGIGRGIVDLCERVEKTGSLNRAAVEMGMAYSKAWRIVKGTEEALGVELFVRKGARGSALTEEARVLVRLYRTMEQRLAQEAEELLDQAFSIFEKRGILEEKAAARIQTKATPELIAEVRAIDRDRASERPSR